LNRNEPDQIEPNRTEPNQTGPDLIKSHWTGPH